MISESSFQLALIVELALITSSVPAANVAAYAAVSATTSFAIGIFNFLLITTMSQIGKANGAKAWHEIGPRFRIGLLTAIIIGVSCVGVLLLLEDFLFTSILQLDTAVELASRQIFKIRLLLIPLMMIQRVCGGLLGGYQRIKALAVRAVLVALCEITSQYIALRMYNFGLVGATIGTVITATFGVVVSLGMVVMYPPKESNDEIKLFSCVCCARKQDQEQNQEQDQNQNEDQKEPTSTSIQSTNKNNTTTTVTCDFASASANTTVRSFLLTSAVYAMSIAAANLGTSALTAHQIAITIWMLMSLVCDGFADVATMLGSKLIGEKNRSKEMIVLRDILMLFGCVTGLVATTSMWYYRDAIINIYNVKNQNGTQTTTTDGVSAKLVMLWPILCGMQVINAIVFVLDGFIYATQSFVFVRNLMLASVMGWFFPVLVIGTTTNWIPGLPHTLLIVWISKAGLNLLRAMGAIWLMYGYFPKKWSKTEEIGSMLLDPLLNERTSSDDGRGGDVDNVGDVDNAGDDVDADRNRRHGNRNNRNNRNCNGRTPSQHTLLTTSILFLFSFVITATAFVAKRPTTTTTNCIHWKVPVYSSSSSTTLTKIYPNSIKNVTIEYKNKALLGSFSSPILCILQHSTQPTAPMKIDVASVSNHLPIGQIVQVSSNIQTCIPIQYGHKVLSSKKYRDFQYATHDTNKCNIWWQEISADVIPPIPELTLPFGQDIQSNQLAICKTFGGTLGSSFEGLENDFGISSLGTFVLAGEDSGKCYFVRQDGTTGVLDGGKFYILQALRHVSIDGDEDSLVVVGEDEEIEIEMEVLVDSDEDAVIIVDGDEEMESHFLPPPRLPLAARSAPVGWKLKKDGITYNMDQKMQNRIIATGRILFGKMQLAGCEIVGTGTDTGSGSGGDCKGSGRVEVQLVDTPGLWMPICSHDWSLREANVICKMMGYKRALHAITNYGGIELQAPAVANVTCLTGLENHIHECNYMNAHPVLSCNVSKESVGVSCM